MPNSAITSQTVLGATGPVGPTGATGPAGSGVANSISQTSHGFAVGDCVRLSGTSYIKAQADSAVNAEVVGIVSAVASANAFTLTPSGRITGLTGLTAGGVYFLSPTTPGAMTATEPTTVGQVSQPVLVADTTTSGYAQLTRGVLIGSGGGATAFIGCRAVKSAAQSIPNNTWTAFALDAADTWDSNGFHDPASNNSRFTIPAGMGGKYLVSASTGWASNTTGTRYHAFALNGTRITNLPLGAPVGGTNGAGVTVTDIIDCAAGDYVEVHVYQDSGGALNSTQGHMTIAKLDSGKVGAGIGAKAYHNTTQTVASGAAHLFNSEEFDTDGFHDTSSNTSRLTVPAGLGGKYVIVGTSFSATSHRLYLRKNGTTTLRGAGATSTYTNVTNVADLVAGDYVELLMAASGSATMGDGSIFDAQSSLSIMRLDSGSSSASTAILLNYNLASDITALALTAGTWADIITNQSFTVVSGTSLVALSVRGMGFANPAGSQIAVRAVVDSGGTPVNVVVGGFDSASSGSRGNAFSGASSIYLSGLAAGSHTVKLQVNANGTGYTFYCRASSGAPQEFLAMQVIEHKN